MKLARQFDKNMQQDKEISEQLNPVNNNPTEPEDTSEAKLVETSLSANAKDSKCLSSSDQAEAELHALFDCSTQKVSGRLSQGSSCSQEVKKQPETSALAEPRQSEQKMSDKSDPSQPARAKGPPGVRGDFDDDWENDDLLNDSFVLAITQNPDQLLDTNAKTRLSDTKANTPQFPSVTNSGHQLPNMHSKPSCSEIQELCPKLKTTNRSTFKLQPNPHFQPKTAVKGDPKSNLTALHSKSKISEEKSVSSKVPTNAQPAKVSNDHKTYPAVSSVRDNPDSLWDDGDDDDDALLFQICDSVERISNSQPQQVCSSISPKKQESGLDSQRKTSAPLPIDATRSSNTSASAYKKSPCSFVRSNSLPGTSCQAGNYQGLNIPLKGANNKSGMSQSLPGSRMSLGTFINRSDSAATFQGGNDNLDLMPHTVRARTPQTSKSCHTAFKRNVSDTAVINNKVFVTSQMRGKCSAAEIERKKQEALARRKQRMQSTQKP
ncbi:ewing's tumor-associated antigen 1 homolog [Xyrichtys novacula]|nr:ewing's tumor-associated antigen 1 homolog [Xyrichtys novacula]